MCMLPEEEEDEEEEEEELVLYTLYNSGQTVNANLPTYSHITVYQIQSVLCIHPEEEEEEFYKLRPANKTDHLCQSWQHCHM